MELRHVNHYLIAIYLYLVDCNSCNSRTMETEMEVAEKTDNNDDSSVNSLHDLSCDLPFPPTLVVSSEAYLESLKASGLLCHRVVNMNRFHF